MNKSSCVIFGGSGFIGRHFTLFLLANKLVDEIYLYDLEVPNWIPEDLNEVKIFFVHGDVRREISGQVAPNQIKFIVNFAAIHREPGHEDYEYFQTNLLGAESICKFAENVKCNNIIFTSSISPYGVSESIKDELTLPIPVTAYGSSKLAAEKIHQIWQAKDINNRRLVIVRPGVVFGPGEGGNVSRLIKAVIHRYFFFMGNESTRKAGVYVKELCNAMWWVLQEQKKNGETVSLFNMSMNPGPSIGEYVKAVCKTQGIKRFFPTVPYKALMGVAYLIDALARPLSIKHPFSPVRIRKLVRSNNIIPTYLVEHGYQFQYSLDSAFTDWKKSCPEEWK
ncbi:NAD(P)-dependent oxidoreductase [Polynucleobacter paneuropaeus]|nr:NAD(P)-dependent oxidoreductase [Polynucleobacter paneuropaeus]MBT8599730.1 NAD(P)-dependent oxidoreductase [Polynucleobacter paneuropaeus]